MIIEFLSSTPQWVYSVVQVLVSVFSLLVLAKISKDQLLLSQKEIEPPQLELDEIGTKQTGRTGKEILYGYLSNTNEQGVARKVSIEEVYTKEESSGFRKRISGENLVQIQFIDLGGREYFELKFREGKLDNFDEIKLLLNSEKLNRHQVSATKGKTNISAGDEI